MEMQQAKKIIINIKYIAFALASLLIISGISIYFYYTGGAWYGTIFKPFIAPENDVNIIIWAVIYVIIAISLYMVLNSKYDLQRENTLRMFLIDATLILIWSFLLYFKHDSWNAFVCIMLMMFCTYWLIKNIYLIKPKAAWLMLPYFFWIGILTVINYNIVMLN